MQFLNTQQLEQLKKDREIRNTEQYELEAFRNAKPEPKSILDLKEAESEHIAKNKSVSAKNVQKEILVKGIKRKSDAKNDPKQNAKKLSAAPLGIDYGSDSD